MVMALFLRGRRHCTGFFLVTSAQLRASLSSIVTAVLPHLQRQWRSFPSDPQTVDFPEALRPISKPASRWQQFCWLVTCSSVGGRGHGRTGVDQSTRLGYMGAGWLLSRTRVLGEPGCIFCFFSALLSSICIVCVSLWSHSHLK